LTLARHCHEGDNPEDDMRYMLMLYADEKAGASIPKDLMAKAMEGLFAYQHALEKAGAFVATSALAPTSDARTIRMEGGEVVEQHGTFLNEGGELVVHDGPYAETREQFGGYFIIEAKDMKQAIEWAKQCPAAQWGPIEIRPYNPAFSP
jgi:hypothetical protein